ncbi:MAG: arylsulfatase, partial [Myxococcaceae bacterium]
MAKPNILFIMGDDIGWFNVSAYNLGIMGYRTPNIDRIAHEGALFTDWYAQQSCTAGRAAFLTGQSPIRTGLTKVGLPGSDIGLQPEDPTIADVMKSLGYATGQFGKNHLGDRDEFLPTVHGFDEFFGNLYHLNAEEEPENVDYPKDPAFRQHFGPRGVLKSKADGKGGQTVEDTGPLTKKRMETVDEEFLAATLDFIDRTQQEQKPFFIWFNTTRMHIHTHLKKESQGKTGIGLFPDGMVEHDGHVGRLLDKLEQLGITDDTIVIYTTDNGAMTSMWPDGGVTPFRGEKDTNWEGAFRAPCLVRWPGVVKPGTQLNELFSSEDWLPTLVSAAGDPDIVRKLLDGHDAGARHFHVHLDGYDQTPLLSGQGETRRDEFYYFGDDGELVAMRYKRFKLVFEEQNAKGIEVWSQPFTTRRVPLIFDLRADPLERSEDSVGYYSWM